ncbi:hypothetical protein EDB83DRAFT_1258861 [Lactarius deliciosus]|nr:hypothetical protein EDB83DRAFT_1258861 [Lactarius deliciosus]
MVTPTLSTRVPAAMNVISMELCSHGHTCDRRRYPLISFPRMGAQWRYSGDAVKRGSERRAIVRHIRYDLSAKRGGGNVHRLLTRGILTLSPIVAPSPYNSSLSFPFRPQYAHFETPPIQFTRSLVLAPAIPRLRSTMPPTPIIAPQPRRLLPQPTIIDPSVPVLPINLDDPFICPYTCPKERSASSPHVSNSHSPYKAFFDVSVSYTL